jgi:hypothetical protein
MHDSLIIEGSVTDPDPGWKKKLDPYPGSGIENKHPGPATLKEQGQHILCLSTFIIKMFSIHGYCVQYYKS